MFLILTVAYCMGGTAAIPTDSWVVSNAGKMNCKNVRVNNSKVRIRMHDGQKVSLPLDQINSYSINGKVFNKLTLYLNGKSTNREVFMQLLRTRNGYSLYKYYRCDVQVPCDFYFVYKGGKFCYALDDSMHPNRVRNLFKYFGFNAILP